MTGKMIDGVWTVDRTHWPPGPWMDEPYREQWKTKAGLPGLIVRNGLGGLCGYVAVPPGHPAFEKSYGDDVLGEVNVHGGLTFSSKCAEDGPVCHVPEPGEPDNVWWLGFDCVHSGDWHPPTYAGARRELPSPPYEVYRDISYVRREVESLAEQLVAQRT